MCEVSPHRRAWTLPNGLCCPDVGYDDSRYPSWNMTSSSALTDQEKCQYLFRCAISNGFEYNCPCNHNNCTQMMMTVCPRDDHLVFYPSPGLINANVFFYYNYSRLMEDATVDGIVLYGRIRCRGYLLTLDKVLRIPISLETMMNPRINNILCGINEYPMIRKDYSSPLQYDKFCWNESRTFNGRLYSVAENTCSLEDICLSQYRIHDGFMDCPRGNDETSVFNKDYCTGNVGRHRFQCYDDQHKCLSVLHLGTGRSDCSNNYDEA
ncbi:unnamed protein product [Rotaria sordida]|uniref:Uncharacterized protein n=1 Tax=Rotaria sordida TaxID=392033 RepID=A0A819KVY1_9BILA|nr:unnamed protein product [Rotaria sordida]CAF1281894.1 unnamed protein product [Rotaria sordida]CAF3952987.1 unnamed protein product [Rotaria sordida]CAF3988960.1 unnamed protein product [Rotaria sordida]